MNKPIEIKELKKYLNLTTTTITTTKWGVTKNFNERKKLLHL
jgi:hypothetical protein